MSTTKDSASNNSSLDSSFTRRRRKMKLFKLYKFLDTTYREIRKYIPGLETANLNDINLMECINKYKKCFVEIYEKEDTFECFDVCRELAQNISRTLDLFKEISAIYTNMDEYYHRVSELLSIFIACELRLSVDSLEDLSLISCRIIYIIKKHLTQEDEDLTRYNILLTLVYIPRLFNAREIVCNVIEEFLPFKSHMETDALPDKIYIMYIIIFYRWMSMKTLDDEKRHIIEMAEKFMKPVISLCNNQLYVPYLPAYTSNRTATRTILCNLKTYQGLRTASIIDNAYKKLGVIVNLCDDDDIIVIDEPQVILCFSEIFAAVQLKPSKQATSVIKHEINTIIDSVDLTVDDEIDTTECSIVMWYEKWLHNFQVMAKQFRESETRLQRHNESRTGKVICLDSDYASTSEEEEVKIPTKRRTKGNKKHSGKASEYTKQNKSLSDNNQLEDLFADNYPLTVTPIHCNEDLESLEVEDTEDFTKLSRRILPIPLQTYESKKSSASQLVTLEGFHNTQENEDEKTPNISRQEKHISFSSSPLGPTSAYSKKGISLSQPTNMSAQLSEFDGGFDRYSSSSSNVSALLTRKQQEHIASASALFCNVFDRSHSSCGIFANNTSKQILGGDLFSSTTGRSSHALLSPTGGFFDPQHKKRNKIRSLMQRRATLSCRSDFDDYMAALETTRTVGNNNNFKIHPGPNDSVCSEVSNKLGFKPVPASTSDCAIINRYQFQDEKLMKNCAVIIEPSAEVIQFERKRRVAMYNELLQKQRRKMELRAIEKLKEKERRRQEKETKREEYAREQKETMEKLERMKINETESSDNQRFGSDKETATERSCLIKHDTNTNMIKHDTQENRTKDTSKVEQLKGQHLQTSDIGSCDSDLIPLGERMKTTRSSPQQNRVKQSTRIRNRRNTTEQSIRSKRIAEVQNYSEKFLASQNSGGRTLKETLTDLTDAKTEPERAPSRNIRERRKSVCSNKLIEQTDSEMESGSRRANSMPRPPSRLQRNFETVHDTDSEIDKTISVKLTRPVRGRPRNQTNMNTKKRNQSKSDVNKIDIELGIEQSLTKPESKENEPSLCERTIVASIAERLCSPATIVVDKTLASSEQEEILDTLEDLLGKETRLSKTVAASDESSSIPKGSPSNVNSSVKIVTDSETSADLEVIENIVINEIQREMDANSHQVKEKTSQAATLQNIISEFNDKSNLGVTRPQEKQTYFKTDKPFRSIPKKRNSPCEGGENVKTPGDEQHIQDMFDKSLQDLPSLTDTETIVAQSATMSLLISGSESLNNHFKESKVLSTVVESRQTSILVTENILLGNSNAFLETSKTAVENNMLPPLPSSLLTDVETSMIQADLSDITPTSINIVMRIDEEDTTMPHNFDQITPEIDQDMDDNLSLETQTNELALMEDNGKESVSKVAEISQTKKSSNVEENLLLPINNNVEEVAEMGSPPYESLRVSSDEDGDKQSTTTDESHPNTKTGSYTSESGGSKRLNSGDMEKLNTEGKSPPFDPLHVSSDDDENNKSEVLNETLTKVNVITENVNESPVIPFKTKASLKFASTKTCQVKIKRVNRTNNISSKNYDVEHDEHGTPIPSPSLDQEDGIIQSEDYWVPSPNAVSYEETLETEHCRQSPFLEEFQSVVIERYDEDSNPLPKILKSTTSQNVKKSRKTVTFHPLAEVISPNKHYENRSIFDRDETPPPEDFYRDHNYDRKFRTLATRKHFNDDHFTEECNLSSSSQESDDDHEELDIVLGSSNGQEDIMRKSVQLQRVLLVPPDACSPLAKTTSPDIDVASGENAEISDNALFEKRTTISEEANGGIQIDNGTTNGSLPIFILGDVIGNMPEGSQLQCSDEGRNVLVSTTYLTNYSSPGDHLVVNTIHNSMMSPSEHEVTSTQEASYQQYTNSCTTERDFLTSKTYSDSVREKSSSANAENSELLQNNQVDTTNHSPDMCALPSTDGRKVPPMSTSTNESIKAEDILAKDNSRGNVSNGYCSRLSPTTTTDSDGTVPDVIAKAHNSRLLRIKTKEPRKIQHNSSKLKHRNPFIVRTSTSSQKLSNPSGPQYEAGFVNIDKMENTSISNCGELNNSKILSPTAGKSRNHENLNIASECPALATVESIPKKKFVLIRPKPYTTQKSPICVNNNEVVVKNSNTNKRFVPITPKPIEFKSHLTNVPQSTNPNTSNHIEKPLMKKVERNLNEEFSCRPHKDKEVKTGAILDSNLEKSVLETTLTVDNNYEIQRMVNELLGQQNKDEAPTRHNIEESTSIIDKQDDAEMKYADTKCQGNKDALGNVAKEIKCNDKSEIEDSGKKLKRNHKKRKLDQRYDVEMGPSKKVNRRKDKHQKEEDSKEGGNEKTGVTKKDSKTGKTVREDCKGTTHSMKNAQKKSPKQQEQPRNKPADSQEAAQNKEAKMNVKINPRNNDGGANVEETNRDPNGKDINIEISKPDTKLKDSIVMQNMEANINQNDNQKMKGLKKRTTEKYNTEVQNAKKPKSDIIIASQKVKAKIDEVEERKILATDPLKIDDIPKKTRKRRHKLNISDTTETKTQNELSGSNKSNTRDEMHERKGTTSTSRVSNKNKVIETNINISTRSSTIIAVKMIPFAGVRQESIDLCKNTVGVGMEKEVVKMPKNQIVGVKMIKVNNVDEAITSSEVRPDMSIGLKTKHERHSVDNSTEDDKKLNRNINSMKKTPNDCEKSEISPSKSATTSASTSKRNSTGSINDTYSSAINKKSISTESSNPIASAPRVHSRKKRKPHI